jgi:hypothetical protein
MSADIEIVSAELRRFAAGMSFVAPRSAVVLLGLADALRTDPEIADAFADAVLARPVAGARLVAGLHDLVLAGQLPALREIMYPTDPDAPPPSPQTLWGLAREAFCTHAEHFQAALQWPVQQHIPDRAGVLLRGLAMLGKRRVRLLELGACAGLTLLLDRYRWRGVGWTWGAAESPLEFVVSSPAPPADLTIVDRAGCDVAPVNPDDPIAVRRLHAFVAAELTTTHSQLDTALGLARSAPVRVVRASAGQWLRRKLAETPDPGVHTVVWHSQVWHLLELEEQDEIRAMMVEAAYRLPLSRISWEPFRVGGRASLCIEDHS